MGRDTLQILTPASVEQARSYVAVAAQTFGWDAERTLGDIDRLGASSVRMLQDQGETIGGLLIIDTAQWFGGKAVPMWAIAAVATAAHRRGDGAAHHLMSEMIREAHAKGVALSTLYAATTALYRKSGYECAGRGDQWELPLRTLGRVEARGDVVPFGDEQLDEAMVLYEQRAAHGNVRRSEALMHECICPTGVKIHRYFLVVDGERAGYIMIDHQRGPQGSLKVRDVVTLTPEAVKLAVSFLLSYRSICETARWCGSPLDLQLLDGNMFPPHLARGEEWMMRVAHVENALEQRGYAPVTAELHLEVEDDIVPDNAGRYVLSLRLGKPTVQRGGQGHVRMHVRGLAPLYSSLLTAEQLGGAGLIRGDADQLAAVSLAFSGPRPCMPDHF